jgi:ferredoxin
MYALDAWRDGPFAEVSVRYAVAEWSVTFQGGAGPVRVPHGTLVIDAARLAKVKLPQKCKKGTCGQCSVLVLSGIVRRQDRRKRSEDDMEADFVPACQSVIESDASITVMG